MTTSTESDRATRVCHVVYGRYPSDPRVLRAVESLAGFGYSMHVVCLRGVGEEREDSLGDVQVLRVPLEAVRGSRLRYLYQYTLFFLMVTAKLLPRSAAGRYHIIHVHSLPDFLVFAALPSRILGSRVVLDLHESMPHLYLARFQDRPGSAIHRLIGVVQKLSCFAATHVVTVNSTIRDHLEANGVPRSKVTIIENAPAWGSTAAGAPSSSGHRAREVVIVGGLNEERDLEIVIRAAMLFSRQHLPLIRIIGRGDRTYVSGLKALRSELGLDERVSIEDEIPHAQVLPTLRDTLFGVVTYKRNPLTEIATPNKAYEYACLGKAMVVADLPALRQLFGEAVLYYEPGRAESLAAAMSRLAEDASLRETFGRRAAEVHHAHRWEIMAARLRGLYDNLCSAAPVPGVEG